MRVCGQWFDTSLRERIMGAVRQEPAISRHTLAEWVCDWLGWRDHRGQPCLGSARRALASHTARAAARLRAAGLVTGLLQVSIATSPFREDEPQYHPTWGLELPVPTADTVPLLRAARAALGLIFRAGYRYQRAGVVLLELSPAGALTRDLFAPVAPAGQRGRRGGSVC